MTSVGRRGWFGDSELIGHPFYFQSAAAWTTESSPLELRAMMSRLDLSAQRRIAPSSLLSWFFDVLRFMSLAIKFCDFVLTQLYAPLR